MYDPYLKQSQPACIILYGLRAADGRSVAAVTKKSKVLCVLKLAPSPLRLPMLHSGSSPALPYQVHEDIQFSGDVKRGFKIYGIWPQANKHTHTLSQCSPTSVGLTQARPNHI